jgi:CheY-like chemotaxis protein
MNILVVDDSIFVRRFLKKYILTHIPQAEIELAASGEEGFQLFKEKQFDLIITDLLMPGINGEELIKMIRKENSSIKIIVLTADVQKAVRDEIESLNITAFLNKPVTNEELYITLSDLTREG